VQFYDKPSHLGFALSTFTNSTGSGTGSHQNELLFQLSVPASAGWGAIGTGDKMDGSLMFILYPSTDSEGKQVILSAGGDKKLLMCHRSYSERPNGRVCVIYSPSSFLCSSILTYQISGHDTPEAFIGLQYRVLKTSNDGSSLTADIQCFNCTQYSGNSIDITSTEQPWIWAIGPGDPVRSNSQNADIEQHSHYGAVPSLWMSILLPLTPLFQEFSSPT